MSGCLVCGFGIVFCKGLCKKCYKREYNAKPEVKAKQRKYQAKYYAKPEVKAKQREYRAKPEVKAKHRCRKPSSDILIADFENHFGRLKNKFSEEEYEKTKKLFVDSVEKVINGGTERIIAKKLGVEK